MSDVVPCQGCAGATSFAAEIQPLGRQPGHRIYFCEFLRKPYVDEVAPHPAAATAAAIEISLG